MKKTIYIIALLCLVACGCSKLNNPTQANSYVGTVPTPAPEMSVFTQGERYCDFSPRYDIGAAAFNNRIYVIGGMTVSGTANDVWYTDDCERWKNVKAVMPFKARSNHSVFEYDKKLWIFGGIGEFDKTVGYLDDVWYSADAVSWTATALPYGGRSGAGIFVGNAAIVATGGSDMKEPHNDVWSSKDGKAWKKLKEDNDKGWTPRSGHGALYYKNKMWVFFGKDKDGKLRTDVWNSDNGVDWSAATVNAGITPRYDFTPFVYKDRMWVSGGMDDKGRPFSDMWWSVNGYYWVSTTAKAEFGPRYGHAAVAFQEKIWFICGRDERKIKRDIWYGQ